MKEKELKFRFVGKKKNGRRLTLGPWRPSFSKAEAEAKPLQSQTFGTLIQVAEVEPSDICWHGQEYVSLKGII